jgi:SAM-dependent methyltransferase
MPSTKPKKIKDEDKEKRPAKSGRKHGQATKGGKRARKRVAEQRKEAPKYTAKSADRYELYEYSVQSPEVDVEFLTRTYKEERGRNPRRFREDFCGTAALCAEWVKQGPDFSAEGFDLDPEPIEWGKKRNLDPLGDDAKRIELQLKDVREKGKHLADVRVAQNFSYQIFKTRKELLEYFQVACKDLAKDGIFVIDLYGGPEAIEEMEEEREIEEGFTYVWDQAAYWPGTGEVECHIHFRFEDGSEMRNAFDYTWRSWTLPELRDLLYEAGFKKVDSYFEGTDEESEDGNDGDGDFKKDMRGDSCPAWVAYLVSHK